MQDLTTTRTTSPPSEPTRNDRTRALLACGVVAGPLFVAVGLAQLLTREGFDPTRHPLSSGNPTSSSISCTRRRRAARATPRIRNPNATLSPTVRWPNSSGFWKTMPTGRRSAGIPARETPSTLTSPALAVSSPATTLSTVVFPQPDGPSSAVKVPAGTTTSIPSTIGTPRS